MSSTKKKRTMKLGSLLEAAVKNKALTLPTTEAEIVAIEKELEKEKVQIPARLLVPPDFSSSGLERSVARLRKKDDARIAKKLQKDADKMRAQGLTPMKYSMKDKSGSESYVVLGLKAGEHPSAGANMLMKKYKTEVLSAEEVTP